MGRLRGDRATAVFNSWEFARNPIIRLWRLGSGRASKCPETDSDETFGSAHICTRLRTADRMVAAAVDGGRVLAVGPGGVVRLLRADGRVLRTWTLGRGVWGAGLQGERIVATRGRTAFVYDVRGPLLRTLALGAPVSSSAELLDVHGDFAV